MNYWQKRNLQAQAAIANKSAKEIDKQLDIYYRRAIGQVVKDFEATYDKLQATMADGAEPTPADLYKLDKYWQMQNQLKEELQKLGNKEVELYSKKFTDLYKAEYEAIAIKGQQSFTKISTETAREMISSVWVADGKSWSERIWDNTAKLADTLNEELLHCVVTGKKTSQLKKLLQERFNSSYYEADRLARTEIAHIQTAAAQKRYEDYGIGQVEIWADKDERRCDVCGKLHKKRYPVGASVPIPAHPNCRCSIIPVVEDEPKTVKATTPQQSANTVPSQDEIKQELQTRANPATNNKRLEQVFKKKTKETTILQDVEATNPNYTDSISYQINCSHTVAAYEMRCRGFDVTATPATNNDKYKQAGMRAWGYKDHNEAIRAGAVHAVKAKRTAGIAAEIENELLTAGNGARFEIRVGWKTGGGHFFAAENKDGKIYFVDPQNATAGDSVAAYFKDAKPSGTWWTRIDNIELDPEIMKDLCK